MDDIIIILLRMTICITLIGIARRTKKEKIPLIVLLIQVVVLLYLYRAFI